MNKNKKKMRTTELRVTFAFIVLSYGVGSVLSPFIPAAMSYVGVGLIMTAFFLILLKWNRYWK